MIQLIQNLMIFRKRVTLYLLNQDLWQKVTIPILISLEFLKPDLELKFKTQKTHQEAFEKLKDQSSSN